MTELKNLKPLGLVKTLLLTFIPSGIFIILLHLVFPALVRAGWSAFLVNQSVYFFMYFLALGIALIMVKAEGGSLSWKYLKERFRFTKLTGKQRLLVIGLALFVFISFILVNALTRSIISKPDYLVSPPGMEFDVTISGAVWLIPFGLVSLVCNIVGEEFIWRGALLPRQELAFGKWAFLVNGVLWALFHAPVYWMIIPILPGAIALAFVCQRTKSIWPGIIVHLFFNLMANVETWIKIFS